MKCQLPGCDNELTEHAVRVGHKGCCCSHGKKIYYLNNPNAGKVNHARMDIGRRKWIIKRKLKILKEFIPDQTKLYTAKELAIALHKYGQRRFQNGFAIGWNAALNTPVKHKELRMVVSEDKVYSHL